MINFINFIFICFITRDGKEVRNTAKNIITQDGQQCTLKIPKITKTDIGLYKCVATNPAGSAECEAPVSLEEEKPAENKPEEKKPEEKKPEQKKPVFEDIFSSTIIKVNDILELKCKVTGEPKPTIKWFKDNKEIKPTSLTKLTQDGPVCILKTIKCTKNDVGVYKCVATNPAGSAECEAAITLEEEKPKEKKPEFEEIFQSISLKPNDVLELKCKVTGEPKPTIQWFKDNKEIKPTSLTKLTQDGPVCVLKTSKFSKNEVGVYKCVATNPAGSAECEATVSLEGQ